MSYINAFLKVSAPPEQQEMIENASRVLGLANVTNHTDRIAQLLDADALYTAQAYVAAIRNIIIDELLIMFQEFGITQSDTLPPDIDIYAGLIESILLVPTLSIKASVLEVLDNEELDDVERLIELSLLSYEVERTSLYLHISAVDGNLFDTIRLQVTDEPDPVARDTLLATRVTNAIAFCMPLLPSDDEGVISIVLDHVEGTNAGYDLKNVFTLLYPELVEMLPVELAVNVYLMVAGSSVKDVYLATESILNQIMSPEELIAAGTVLGQLQRYVGV